VHLQIEPKGFRFDGTTCVVGVNISGLLYMGGYTRRNMFRLRDDYQALIDRLLRAILTETNAAVLLVPHVFGLEEEEIACAKALQTHHAHWPGRVFALAEPLTEHELKWLIGKTDFFIGSRMHACIAALSQAVPALGLAYSNKFLGVFESAGVGDATIDLRNVAEADVIARTLTALRNRSEMRSRLKAGMPGIQRDIFRTFCDLGQRPAAAPVPPGVEPPLESVV
jgi:polysaccharide pyruvyl transferase WcaK-like protein